VWIPLASAAFLLCSRSRPASSLLMVGKWKNIEFPRLLDGGSEILHPLAIGAHFPALPCCPENPDLSIRQGQLNSLSSSQPFQHFVEFIAAGTKKIGPPASALHSLSILRNRILLFPILQFLLLLLLPASAQFAGHSLKMSPATGSPE
jgi:hypothetical protein